MRWGKEGERTAQLPRRREEGGARNGNKIRPVFGEPADERTDRPSADFALGPSSSVRRYPSLP